MLNTLKELHRDEREEKVKRAAQGKAQGRIPQTVRIAGKNGEERVWPELGWS